MFRRISSGIVLLILLAAVGRGQTTFIWTGLGGNADMATPGNWQGGVAPSGNSTDQLIFGPVDQANSSPASGSLNVGTITFSNTGNYYFVNPTAAGPATFTVNGDIVSTTGSTPFGVIGLGVALPAGNHIVNSDGAGIYLWGGITGAGTLIKNGNSLLTFSNGPSQTAANSYSGGTIINQGQIEVGRTGDLGTGTVTLADGAMIFTGYTEATDPAVLLPNNFIVGANPTFGGGSTITALVLGSNANATTITPMNGISGVTFTIYGAQSLTLDGRMTDSNLSTSYTFSGSADTNVFHLSGDNSYTGGTLINDNSYVVFDRANSIPANGLISASNQGYAGLGDDTVSVPTFLSHFNHADYGGIIGFDNNGVYSGDIDLSGFSNTGLSLGTLSSATLTGAISPVAGINAYQFSGSGTLFLQDAAVPNLATDNNNFFVTSLFNKPPLMLILNRDGSNQYRGSLNVGAAGLVFDSVDARSSSGQINFTDSGGYVSVTDTSGLTLASLVLGGLNAPSGGILGVDSHNYLYKIDQNTYNYNTPVDFSSLTSNVFLGTASKTNLSSTIETANNGLNDYFLTGYNGGDLKVSSLLTDNFMNTPRVVNIGAPVSFQSLADGTFFSTVELTNFANSFTGGIRLNSGLLIANDPRVLGPGPVYINATSTEGLVALQTTGTLSNQIQLDGGILLLKAKTGLAITGVISGTGSLESEDNITLSGTNTYSGNTFLSNLAQLTASSDFALGTSAIQLSEGASILFTSTSPQIGSLQEGDANSNPATQARLILANAGGTTLTINQQGDGDFAGAIVQSSGTVGSVVKTGPGTLTLGGKLNSGDTPYSGGTTIIQGQLVAGSNTALGTGPITINGGGLSTTSNVVLTNNITFGTDGGQIGGSGTIGVPITVGSGVILAPGNSPGNLTFTSGLTLASGGALNFQIQSATGAAGLGYDLVTISSGALDITASATATFAINLISLDGGGSPGNVTDFASNSAYSWMIFTGNSTSGITGFSANKFALNLSGFSNSTGGGSFSLLQGVYAGNPALFLNFSPVPEPSSYSLMLGGLGAVAWFARRRRRA